MVVLAICTSQEWLNHLDGSCLALSDRFKKILSDCTQFCIQRLKDWTLFMKIFTPRQGIILENFSPGQGAFQTFQPHLPRRTSERTEPTVSRVLELDLTQIPSPSSLLFV